MFIRELALTSFLAAASTVAYSQDAAVPEVPRTAAALPSAVGDLAEPMPPSPVIDNPESGETPTAGGGLGIGRSATKKEIAAIDIDVMPDGAGLPAGRGTYQQGEKLYAERCASCHGEKLEGIKQTGAPALIGYRGSLNTDAPVKTVESYWPYASTLFDYVHRAMPMNEPGSLSADEVYSLSAFILGKANILPKDKELNFKNFREIKMPNAKGFVQDPRPGGL
jgi:S-disulfanyl-L-cysteine oxidoreductase SoxD